MNILDSEGNPLFKKETSTLKSSSEEDAMKKKERTDVISTIKKDSLIDKLKLDSSDLKKKYLEALRELRAKEQQLEAIANLNSATATFKITPRSAGKSEAVPFIIASDWHVDETIKPESVNKLNSFDEVIAKERAEWFFKNALTLIRITERDVSIKDAVLALLGDFISGNIHEELLEGNSMLPMEAILFAQSLISSGIDFFLNNSKLNFIIPCAVGNHSRITKKVHVSTERGNSLEYFMYHSLALKYKEEKRVKFIIPNGYLCYLDVYNYPIRLHHGHNIRYAGGVGGITIPLNKAISQWNKAKTASLDVLGHWHQFRDSGNAIINGSLLGYAAYSLSIKADYEKPKQGFFLLDKKRGKTIVAPILLEHT